MNNLTRYTIAPKCNILEDENGKYVLYEDIKRLLHCRIEEKGESRLSGCATCCPLHPSKNKKRCKMILNQIKEQGNEH